MMNQASAYSGSNLAKNQDVRKYSPGTGLFIIQIWMAGQRRLGIPAPTPVPAPTLGAKVQTNLTLRYLITVTRSCSKPRSMESIISGLRIRVKITLASPLQFAI